MTICNSLSGGTGMTIYNSLLRKNDNHCHPSVRFYYCSQKIFAFFLLFIYLCSLILESKEMMGKFYNQGLKFECAGCGECCRLPGGGVEVAISEAREIAAYLNISYNSFVNEYCISDEDGLKIKDNDLQHCIFLEHGRCKIYEVRPLQCRTFPFWPENIKSQYRWNLLKDFCPGIDSGRHYSIDRIEGIRLMQKNYDKKRKKIEFCQEKD